MSENSNGRVYDEANITVPEESGLAGKMMYSVNRAGFTTKHTMVMRDSTEFEEARKYLILSSDIMIPTHTLFGNIVFQNGPIKEVGVNGCHIEDLILICVDRLCYFQSTQYSCEENAAAINSLMDAIQHLRTRTAGREMRGVEGISEV